MSDSRPSPDEDEEFCAACGELIDADAPICPACGDQRQVGSSQSDSRDVGERKPTAVEDEASASSRSGTGSVDTRSASDGSIEKTTTTTPAVNGWRWKIGWHPLLVVVLFVVFGGVVGAMIDAIGGFLFIGLVAGIVVWLWGRAEVNGKYRTLLEDFRDRSRSKVERETGGMTVSSAHTFIGGNGNSPILIEPSEEYKASHLLFGDTSIVINRQYRYEMEPRKSMHGGRQQEVFYDQITNVQSEDFANYADLQIALSSGETERIRGQDASGINAVKRDLQEKMREARR